MSRKNKKSARVVRSTSVKGAKRTRRAASRPPAEASKVDLGVAKVNAPLKAVIQKAKKLLAKLTGKDVATKHAVALMVRKVTSDEQGKKYGKKAVKNLMAALKIDRASLYRWGKVVEVWPTRSGMEKVLSRRNCHGDPITWSHLELLAEVPADSTREELLSIVLEKGLSVRELRLQAGVKKTRKGPTKTLPLRQVGTIWKQADVLMQEQLRWSDTFSRLSVEPASPEQKESLEKLRDACNASLAAIEAVLAKDPASLPEQASSPQMAVA